MDVKSEWYERNVTETNGLTTAASNIQRIVAVKELNKSEKEVCGILTEKVGLNMTSLQHWIDLQKGNETRIALSVARLKVKVGLVDEAIEILAQFDEETCPKVNKQIGYILSLAGIHDFALKQYMKAVESHPDDLELRYAIGVSAMLVGGENELIIAKKNLIKCCGLAPPSISYKALSAMIAIAFLNQDTGFFSQILAIGSRLPKSDELYTLLTELEVRQFLIR